MADFKIIFMGTPEFALPSLQILIDHGYEIVGVITAPDRPKGRGQMIAASPIKEFSLKHGLNILQPVNLKNEDFQKELKALNPDLQVVVAFRMLPELVWKIPKFGTINLHASLLPQYRGAAPINWVIINGEDHTGLTTFFIEQEIDKGKILLQEAEPIYPTDDAGSLHERLMSKGADLVAKTVDLIKNGKVNPINQISGEDLKMAPKISKEMCVINFNRPAEEVHDLIRGLSPFPGASTKINSRNIKIFKSSFESKNINSVPGSFITDNRSFLKFQTGSGVINVMDLQAEGRKRMEIKEFFRGNKL